VGIRGAAGLGRKAFQEASSSPGPRWNPPRSGGGGGGGVIIKEGDIHIGLGAGLALALVVGVEVGVGIGVGVVGVVVGVGRHGGLLAGPDSPVEPGNRRAFACDGPHTRVPGIPGRVEEDVIIREV